MEDLNFALEDKIFTKNSIPSLKVICSKCGGAGNFKTPENSRKTCLECFGKGFIKI